MHLHNPTAEIFIPDGLAVEAALQRTTHLCVSAHQDDIEIMAAGAILACYHHPQRWFTGVVVTDGRGSPRNGVYEQYNDDDMRRVRFNEQRNAAAIGGYAAVVLLDYPSKAVKSASDPQPVEDLLRLLQACRPQEVYTHNLADKHDTHVSVALRAIAAIRRLPADQRPRRLYGCEVWRDLDWMMDGDKAAFDLSAHENLQAALLGVYDSQIAGGKRYDLASMGRRRANATYSESHGVDVAAGLSYAMDLTPLIEDEQMDIQAYVTSYIDRFAQDVAGRIQRFG